MRFWKPEDIFCTRCPHCAAELEFWKDEPFLFCRACGSEIRNPRINLGCAKWCKFAQECLGRLLDDPDVVLPVYERVLAAVRGTFGADLRRIEHARRVLECADLLLAQEGGSPLVVKCAALLHDIGIAEAERVTGSQEGHGERGVPLARAILREAGVAADEAERICAIVRAHHDGRIEPSVEFNVVWDADALVNFPDLHPQVDTAGAAAAIERCFRTGTGRRLALERYGHGTRAGGQG